jgi:hypothetical protein
MTDPYWDSIGGRKIGSQKMIKTVAAKFNRKDRQKALIQSARNGWFGSNGAVG